MGVTKVRKKLGDYTLIEKIGQGTSSEVWKAKKGEKLFAIKLYKEGFESYVEREFGLMLNLEHPHIIDEYEIGKEGKQAYMVMDLLEGIPMEKADWNDYSMQDIEKMAIDIADALKHAHSQKPEIIHKDLKPANIFIEANNHVKVLDFGASASISYQPSEKLIAGSYSYMSPEQLMGETNIQNDVWSFGVTFYKFLTGKHPYQSKTIEELSEKMLLLEVNFPHHENYRISAKLSYVIMKCLRKNPSERYKDFSEILTDLKGRPLRKVRNKLRWRNVGLLFKGLGIVYLVAYGINFLFTEDFAWVMISYYIIGVVIFGKDIYQISTSYVKMNRKILIRDFIKSGSIVSEDKFHTWLNTLNDKEAGQGRVVEEYLLSWNFKHNNLEKAYQLAESLITKDQNNIPALSFFTYWYYKNQDPETASDYWERLINLNSGDSSGLFYQKVLSKAKSSTSSDTPIIHLAETQERPPVPKMVNSSLDKFSRRIAEKGIESLKANIIQYNFQNLYEFQDRKGVVDKRTTLSLELIFSKEQIEFRLDEQGGKSYEKLARKDGIPIPARINYSDILCSFLEGKILKIKDYGWYVLRFEPYANMAQFRTFLTNKITPFSKTTFSETDKIIAEADSQKRKKKGTSIKKMMFLLIGILGLVKIYNSFKLLEESPVEEWKVYTDLFLMISGGIVLVYYGLYFAVVKQRLDALFTMIKRPFIWYHDSRYNSRDYPRLLKIILASGSTEVDENLSLTSQNNLLKAKPFEIDLENEALSYKGDKVLFSDVYLIQINHRAINIFAEGGDRISFNYRNTDYETYMPIFCRYFGSQMEMTL